MSGFLYEIAGNDQEGLYYVYSEKNLNKITIVWLCEPLTTKVASF